MAESETSHKPQAPMLSSSVQEVLEQASTRWKACENAPDADLLRLCVLRDLVHELHAQKSRLLSVGQRDEAASIRTLENRIEELRTGKPLSAALPALLHGSEKLKKHSRILPSAVFNTIQKEKLERYDRQWEASIAAEAITRDWRIWSLEIRVEVTEIGVWNRRLVDTLWPEGIVLFVESAAQDVAGSEQDGAPETAPSWLGRWICLLNPQFKAPSDITVDVSSWPGTASAPAWRVLFSSRSVSKRASGP